MRLIRSVLFNICIVYTFSLSETSGPVPVDVSHDQLDQYVMRTWTNRSFYGFRGIRYAQPPVGQLRFQVG